MIIENIAKFLRRASDLVMEARNGARIVLGTDRQSLVGSGYGDGGKDRPGSAAIDIVVGVVSGDVNFPDDKSRVYLSALTDPDKYALTEDGPQVSEAPGAIVVSDHIRLRARQTLKIVTGKTSILLNADGTLQIETENECSLKSKSFNVDCGGANLRLDDKGGIYVGKKNGLMGNVLTDLDVPKMIATMPGPIVGTVTLPVAQNQNVKIVA